MVKVARGLGGGRGNQPSRQYLGESSCFSKDNEDGGITEKNQESDQICEFVSFAVCERIGGRLLPVNMCLYGDT